MPPQRRLGPQLQQPKSHRQAISHKQRSQLRIISQKNPRWRQAQLQAWADAELGLKLSQSTISDCLSARYAFLDEATVSPSILKAKKSRAAEHPLLETALHEYLTRLNAKGVTVTGDVIQQTARLLWAKMPDFSHLEIPSFSRGWLDGFKSRFSYKFRQKHGELASTNSLNYAADLNAIQILVSIYHADDIYNVDETGLFWRKSPSTTLSDVPLYGSKADRQRLSVVPCVNASGTHKLDLWVIGKAKNPHAFGTQARHIRNLPLHWRYNQKAWMNSMIFYEWLIWFDNQMRGRKVLLLMDNFSSHEKAVCEAIEAGALRFTRVAFLPPNTTALFQPLDQGIINNLKLYYRKLWLEFIIDQTFQDQEPFTSLTQLNAVHWIVSAWDDVKVTTIANCWTRSRLFGQTFGPIPKPKDWDEDRAAVLALIQRTQISTAMEIGFIFDDFIEPEEEQLVEPEEDLLDHIAQSFSEVTLEDDEDDLDGLFPPLISMSDASDAVRKLIQYEEISENCDFSLLQLLRRHERKLKMRRQQQIDDLKSQSTLDRFLITRNIAN